jgi:hypothetical protein
VNVHELRRPCRQITPRSVFINVAGSATFSPQPRTKPQQLGVCGEVDARQLDMNGA